MLPPSRPSTRFFSRWCLALTIFAASMTFPANLSFIGTIRSPVAPSASLVLTTSRAAAAGELLPTYSFPPGFIEPPHLAPLDPKLLIPSVLLPIDDVHRNGYVHAGHVVVVVDSSGFMLFLRRSPTVVTCPGTWSTLGEHAVLGESTSEAVRRAVWEELGVFIVDQDGGGGGGGGGDGDGTATIVASIRNMTEHPLYYIRHYGLSNGYRVDRQLTYLWLVRLKDDRHGDVPWRFDEEVADHKWIAIDEFEGWLNGDWEHNANGDTGTGTSGSEKASTTSSEHSDVRAGPERRDDGASAGDFCHDTIRALYQAMLGRQKIMAMNGGVGGVGG